MKPLAEIFRFSIFLALIGAFVMFAFGVNALTDYRSSNDIAGWVLIGLGVYDEDLSQMQSYTGGSIWEFC